MEKNSSRFEEMFDFNSTYKKTLNYYFKNLQIAQNPTILNIGCGKCLEGEILRELFNGNLIGIDNDEKVIQKARDINNYNYSRFIIGDARKIDKYIQTKADLVILRHPNLAETNWTKILKNCYKLTNPNGILLVTSCLSTDYELSKKPIEKSGYKIEIREENPYAHFISRRGPFSIAISDGYITIAKKSKQTILQKFFNL